MTARVPGIDAKAIHWEPRWAPLLLRLRPWLLLGWLLMHALAFNGQWRMGPDTAAFRSVARSLAAGEGYAILGEPQKLVYPGLPFLLAGLEKFSGPAIWPAVLLMLLMSAAALWFTYALMLRILPPWGATVVAIGVGTNALLVELSHEVLTDVPFLLAVVMVLWGWDTVMDPVWRRRVLGGAALLAGLALAAVMKPTFWTLAAALVLACVGGLLGSVLRRNSTRVRGKPWQFYAGCLLFVALVGLGIAAVDPRTDSLNILSGGYEAEVLQRVLHPAQRLQETPGRLWTMLEDHLEEAFFALRVEILNIAIAAALLTGVVLVARYRPLWGLTFLLLLATIYVASSTPRYYLMVIPILWAGWLLLACMLAARWFTAEPGRSRFVLLAVGVVITCNLGHVVKLVIEQRSVPFLDSYQHGRYRPVVALAGVIAEVTGPQDRIIAPYASELTYLSNRRVLGQRQLLRASGSTDQLVDVLLATRPEWAVFPATVYYRRERALYHLGRRGIFVPKNQDDSTVYSIGTFEGVEWYLTREWAIDETMLPERSEP